MKTATLTTSRFETLVSDLAELVKARLSFLVLLTTLVGFLMGWQGPMSYLILTATLVGTAFCACGAAALNQWWERDFDARMKRTQQRPLPAKRIHPSDALLFGLLFSLSGLAVLFIFTNIRAALLALITITIYLLVYTPMKRISSLNTLVGAIPGALPPLIGWQPLATTRSKAACSLPFCGSGRCPTSSQSHGCTAKTMRGQVLSCFQTMTPRDSLPRARRSSTPDVFSSRA